MRSKTANFGWILYVGDKWVNNTSATIFNFAFGVRTRKYKNLMLNTAFVVNVVGQGSGKSITVIGISQYFTLASIGIRLGVEW